VALGEGEGRAEEGAPRWGRRAEQTTAHRGLQGRRRGTVLGPVAGAGDGAPGPAGAQEELTRRCLGGERVLAEVKKKIR
jgi:hypothetical protein